MNIPILRPNTLSFITTYQCTAACDDCCFKCSPKQKERLSLKQMKDYLDQSIALFPSIKLVVITGGECFTLGEDLYAIIEYIHSKNLFSRIVTNGSWGTTPEKAQQIVKKLIDRGLNEINFSTGDSHQKFVPIETVINAIEASLINQLSAAVNVETHNEHSFQYKDLQEHPRIKPFVGSQLLTIVPGLWISEQEDKMDPIRKKLLYGHQKRCKELFHNVCITPNSELLACCGLTTLNNPYLNIGSLKETKLEALWNIQFDDFIKIWLYTEGPAKIIDFVRTINPNIHITTRSLHICEVCKTIFSNPDILDILQKNYKKVLSRVLLEYSARNPNKNNK